MGLLLLFQWSNRQQFIWLHLDIKLLSGFLACKSNRGMVKDVIGKYACHLAAVSGSFKLPFLCVFVFRMIIRLHCHSKEGVLALKVAVGWWGGESFLALNKVLLPLMACSYLLASSNKRWNYFKLINTQTIAFKSGRQWEIPSEIIA